MTKDLDMYAQVLVEVDFSNKDLKYELIVERTGVCNKIEVAYEDISNNYSFCCLVHHTLSKCRETCRKAESIILTEKRGGDQSHARSIDRRQGRSYSHSCKGKSLTIMTGQEYMHVVCPLAPTNIANIYWVVPMVSRIDA